MKKLSQNLKPIFDESEEDPQIFFLGTNAMAPNMQRGASGIYILRKGHGILMDCAEGSYG